MKKARNSRTPRTASPLRPRTPRKNRYAALRAASLIGVHVLFGIHIAHWYVSGRTLAPLELNEVMYTLELGIVTAGFLLMATAVAATAVFGRFFCSWGCHILALQDASAWILRKLRIRPVAIRSRVLLFVPPAAAFYMFAWPQVSRLWRGDPLPNWRIGTDAEGWASFLTENFWRNLPGPGVALLTFFIVGFLVVYVLGSRSFCRYGCPYGAVFGLVDRLAPGRIRLVRECGDCGACTAVCQSDVRVHEELYRYGTVVNPACLKDLDCVAACPSGAVRFEFGRPSILTLPVRPATVTNRHSFSWAEEFVLAAVFLLILFIYRGLYDLIPFLMSLALAALGSYLAVVGIRLLRNPDVRLNRWPLKLRGRWTRAGMFTAATCLAFLLLTVHSGFIRFYSWRGLSRSTALQSASVPSTPEAVAAAEDLEKVVAWGLWTSDRTERALIDMYRLAEFWPRAEKRLRDRLAAGRADAGDLERLGRTLAAMNRSLEAIEIGRRAAMLQPQRHDLQYLLAGWSFRADKLDDAEAHLRRAIALRPDFAEAHFDLGALKVRQGDPAAGAASLREAIRLRADYAEAHYNLAVALVMLNRHAEALESARTAFRLAPGDPQTAKLYDLLREEN